MSDTTKKYKTWEPLLLSMVTLLGMIAGANLVGSGAPRQKAETVITSSKYSGRQVEEIIRFLETKYVGEISSDDLVYKAIEAIMQGLDPHTRYFPPDQVTELEEKNMGYYVGVGIEIAFLGDSLVVLHPRKGSPAAHAGLRPGDYILAVDDKAIPNDSLSHQDILGLIKGARGTKVRLSVRPMASDTVRQVEIVRDEIRIPSVATGYMIDTAVAYIKVQRFTNSTYREFMEHWERLYEQDGARHLVLDLRNNPGGYLKEAVNMLSQIFAEEGKLLVYTEGKNHDRLEYKSTGKVFFPVEHLVVLINEGSASASEIIAGCIQDHDRGVVVGMPSYGKGLVQEQYDLSNGGTLRMTVSRYFTPSGRLIQKAYDSLSVVDTQAVYRTMSGRPVYAGGGIVPDIRIQDHIDWTRPGIREWMDIISEYAIRYNHAKYQGEIISPDYVEAVRSVLPSEAAMIDGLKAVAARRLTSDSRVWSKYLEEHKDTLLLITRTTLIAYRTGEEGWYRACNLYDPAARRSVELVRVEPAVALALQ